MSEGPPESHEEEEELEDEGEPLSPEAMAVPPTPEPPHEAISEKRARLAEHTADSGHPAPGKEPAPKKAVSHSAEHSHGHSDNAFMKVWRPVSGVFEVIGSWIWTALKRAPEMAGKGGGGGSHKSDSHGGGGH